MLKLIKKIFTPLNIVLGVVIFFSWYAFSIYKDVKVKEIELTHYTMNISRHIEPKYIGMASWYDYELAGGLGYPCQYGSGCYTESVDIAAVRDYPRGTILEVTNLENDKKVLVKVTDYGPVDCAGRIKLGLDSPQTCKERMIDLSSHAFAQIANLGDGLVKVSMQEMFSK